MLYYGMTEEELLEIEESKGWECYSEDGDVAFIKCFETSNGIVEVRICSEGDPDSGCDWSAWPMDGSNWSIIEQSVPAAVVAVEKLFENNGG